MVSTVSLLTDHLVFSPKYRGKVLEGKVAEAAEEIIWENCKEWIWIMFTKRLKKKFIKKASQQGWEGKVYIGAEVCKDRHSTGGCNR